MSVNMEQFTGKGSRPKAGDVFEVLVGGHRCLGRVVSTTAKAGPSMPGAILIYLLSPVARDWTPEHRGPFQVANLITGPIMTNLKPWALKYFHTLGNLDFAAGERLERLASSHSTRFCGVETCRVLLKSSPRDFKIQEVN